MDLKIIISGRQGAGKSTMARYIAEICERERLSYRIIDDEGIEIIEGPMAADKDERPEISVTTRQT